MKDYLKNNLVYLSSIAIGFITWIFMGFNFIWNEYNPSIWSHLSGWNCINFTSNVFLSLTSICLILCVILSFILVFSGIMGLIENSSNQNNLQKLATRFNQKFNSKNLLFWIICGFAFFVLLTLIFLGIWCSSKIKTRTNTCYLTFGFILYCIIIFAILAWNVVVFLKSGKGKELINKIKTTTPNENKTKIKVDNDETNVDIQINKNPTTE